MPAPSTRTRRAASIVGDRAAAAGGRALRFEPMRNAAASPLRYRIDDERAAPPDDRDRRRGRGLLGHRPLARALAGGAVPDRRRPGAIYPDPLYVLVSLSADEADAATGEPSVRAWRILDGEVTEVVLR